MDTRERSNVRVVLELDAHKLYQGADLDDCYEFIDSNGRRGRRGRSFESEVWAAKFVTWRIKKVGRNRNQFDIELMQLDFLGSETPFNTNPINGKGRSWVRKKVLNTSRDYEVKYDITFVLKRRGPQQVKRYTIDPKLRVRKRLI